MSQLSITKQKALYKAMPESKKLEVKKFVHRKSMKGRGVKEILAKIGSVLGPLAKEFGPQVLKQIIMPLLIKKGKEYAGVGLNLPGGGLKLAGQGKKMKKGSAEMKAHMAKLRAMRKK